ncbi:MAG TPA: helix-turn-helix transcriptional regulator [Pirellulales bacterium]|jgi:PadR family transcriptional regulator PadR|nr:helix-turn-helix transcriptional regulator [Pirellulales bacterium]
MPKHTAKNTNPDFLNGVPELLLLQLLARRPMHGYELVQAIEQSTGQVLEFGEGCIYPVLHRLEKDEFLASRRETVNGRSRVVYRPTAAGRKRLAGSTAAWRSIVGAVNQVLSGEPVSEILGGKHGKPAGA